MPIERIIAHVESKQKTLEEASSKAGKTKNDEPVLQKYIKKFCSSIAERFVESDFAGFLVEMLRKKNMPR